MIGDDLAGQSVSMAQKGAEIALEIARLLKSMYDTHRDRIREQQYHNGDISWDGAKIGSGEVKLSKLEKSGNISMQTNISSVDMKVISDKAKEYGIPVAFTGKSGNNSVTVAFREKDKALFQGVMQDVMQNKLAQKPNDYLTFTIKPSEAETLSEMLKAHDIPADFVTTSKGDIQCMYEVKNAAAVKIIKDDFKELHKNVAENLNIAPDPEGRKVTFSDKSLDKSFTISSLPTKEKLARAFEQQLGYSRSQALEAAKKYESTLSGDRLKYFRTDTRQASQLNHFERNITSPDDSLLVKPYTFTRASFTADNVNRFLITDGEKAAALIPEKMSRAEMEDIVKIKLGVTDNETIKAIVDKAEKIDAYSKIQDLKKEAVQGKGDIGIERQTGNVFEVSQGEVKKRYSLKDIKAAAKEISKDFGVSEKQAAAICKKAKNQSVIQNDLHKAQQSKFAKKDTVKHKTNSKGARA